MSYTEDFLTIVSELDWLMQWFSHSKKDIGYGYRWTFANGQRVDLIDYKKQWTTILRVGRGAWLVRKYPILYSLFDEVMTVLAKLRVPTTQTLHEKHIVWILELLDQAPVGIGAFD